MSHGFFTIISRTEFEELLRGFSPLPVKEVPLSDATGRVLRSDLISSHDWPLLDRSCMDGFAVNARDCFGAGESNPAYLECMASLAIDESPDVTLEPGQCARIATGGVLPDGADAVVMVEHTHEMGDGDIEVRKSVAPGENVMRRGEDAQTDTAALSAGTALRPQEIGLAAALGFETLPVTRRPKVGVLSTGDELVEISEKVQPGKVRDVNTSTVAALTAQAGGVANAYGIVKDDLESLTLALKRAVEENDLVLLSGGSSIGVRDLTVTAMDALDDAELLAHGVAISPGKPTILGRCSGVPVMGLPGQATSALVVMHVLVLPLIRHLQGDPRAFDAARRPMRRARLARNVASKPGREDYVRMRLEPTDELPLAHPLLGKSGLLRTMVQADGAAVIPAQSEGLYEGDLIDIWIL